MFWGPSLVADIFNIAAQARACRATADNQIMALVQMMPEIDTDPELPIQQATAMFACFVGKSELHPAHQLTLKWRCFGAWRRARRKFVRGWAALTTGGPA